MTGAETARPSVVALGGGHGLAASLRALTHVSDQLTAIVTVADDGGSSGRLRGEFGCLPPGDLRMALTALCSQAPREREWANVLQHRFASAGPLNGHALGNLIITGLWQLHTDSIDALDQIGALVGARGRVMPMANVPLEIAARVRDVGAVRGQARVAMTQNVEEVWLEPSDPPVDERVLSAVREADWVVLGPGSWFTSVLPHLMVSDLHDALVTTPARRAVVMNLSAGSGEAAGLSQADHLAVLEEHSPDLRIDVVICDPSVRSAALDARVEQMGARAIYRPVRGTAGQAVHDELRLATAFREAFAGIVS
ncbi:uridine diphosphate-N-acetylglucosamine-binding protein YvcK [Buchananella felis]|uniref:gluconeogenesis factor YvcK family protein n=1 Tax=Buchananella felis TaxID=3231492 RepID=UPI003527E847